MLPLVLCGVLGGFDCLFLPCRLQCILDLLVLCFLAWKLGHCKGPRIKGPHISWSEDYSDWMMFTGAWLWSIFSWLHSCWCSCLFTSSCAMLRDSITAPALLERGAGHQWPLGVWGNLTSYPTMSNTGLPRHQPSLPNTDPTLSPRLSRLQPKLFLKSVLYGLTHVASSLNAQYTLLPH